VRVPVYKLPLTSLYFSYPSDATRGPFQRIPPKLAGGPVRQQRINLEAILSFVFPTSRTKDYKVEFRGGKTGAVERAVKLRTLTETMIYIGFRYIIISSHKIEVKESSKVCSFNIWLRE